MHYFSLGINKTGLLIYLIITIQKLFKSCIYRRFVPLLELFHMDNWRLKWIFFRKLDFENEFVPFALVLCVAHEYLKVLLNFLLVDFGTALHVFVWFWTIRWTQLVKICQHISELFLMQQTWTAKPLLVDLVRILIELSEILVFWMPVLLLQRTKFFKVLYVI